MRFSYNLSCFVGEPVERSIERLARYGYDGLEVAGEPETTDVSKIRRLVQQHGIAVSSVVCLFPKGTRRDLISPNPETRRMAMDYYRGLIDMACELDTDIVILNPSACMKVEPEAPAEDEWKWAIETTREVAEYAASSRHSLELAIEPYNRYETYFINQLDEALRLKHAVGLNNIGVLGDFFHMAIEEKSMEKAISKCGKDLTYVHVTDSNRATPGKGHLNFSSLLGVLNEIGYDRYLLMEDLALKPQAYWGRVARNKEELYEAYAREAIKYIKDTLAKIEK